MESADLCSARRASGGLGGEYYFSKAEVDWKVAREVERSESEVLSEVISEVREVMVDDFDWRRSEELF